MQQQYYYISLKWTHKNDGFITLWGPNSNGYQWYQSWIGKYGEPYDPSANSVKSVLCDVADPLFEKVRFDGKEVMILPNTELVRAILGIRKAEFQRSYRSQCPDINELDYIKVVDENDGQPGVGLHPKKKVFERVDLSDKIRADADGMPVFRHCFPHETLMSFYDDSGNVAFREWWGEQGSYLFNEWLKATPEYQDDANI